jgi:hypothetical protein
MKQMKTAIQMEKFGNGNKIKFKGENNKYQ